MEYPQFHWN